MRTNNHLGIAALDNPPGVVVSKHEAAFLLAQTTASRSSSGSSVLARSGAHSSRELASLAVDAD